MAAGHSLLDTIWHLHAVLPPQGDDDTLLYVDRTFVHEESNWAFDTLREQRGQIRNPERIFTFVDHYAPTIGRVEGVAGIANADIRSMLDAIEANARTHGLRHFGLADPRQGIMHVVAPELGLAQPGMVLVGSDSHTCTAGALGAYAFGVGQSELKQVFLTQTVWRARPRQMRVTVHGALPAGTSAKDLILHVIAIVGVNGARGHVVEYAGSGIGRLTIEQRMTVCSMSIEMGAQSGIIAPDDTTFAYLAGCPLAPQGEAFEQAMRHWRSLASAQAAACEREISLEAAAVAPMVTWGTLPDEVIPVSGRVPDPAQISDADRRARMRRALDYMALVPGTPIAGLPIDVVFIGSCTNSRIEDLRAAAAVIRGLKARVPAIVSPGSRSVKRQAEAEGLDAIFKDAGFAWRDSGCSMCVGSNGDLVAPGRRCASTSPRNFEGRQGVGARTHVMSPAMAAAAALCGRIADVRPLLA